MFYMRALLLTLFFAIAMVSVAPAQDYPLIIRGKVTMQDGSAPPKRVGIQRVCSDIQGSAPGPLTDAKGEFLWRMDVDPMRVRVCHLEATLAGYVSSRIDISNLNGFKSTTIDLQMPLVLRPEILDPRTINSGESDIPSKAKPAWKAAMKAVDADNLEEAYKQLQSAADAAPKSAHVWHTLGIVSDALRKLPESRAAYQHAVESDPKAYASYVTLARVSIKVKDWQNVVNIADALIKADTKQTYPEIHLHRSVALFKLKDLNGAEAAAKDAVQKYQIPRAEFVLGRIAEAKGDLAGAREHISRYIALDPQASDIGQIKAYLELLGKPEAAALDPELEVP